MLAWINAFLNTPGSLGSVLGIAFILLLIGLTIAAGRQDRPKPETRVVARIRVKADGSVWHMMSDGSFVLVVAGRLIA